MKLTEFIVVVLAALLFLLPSIKNDAPQLNQIQAEEAPREELEANGQLRHIRITYKVTNPRLEQLADIIWMKKAAEVAKEAGIPYFNIVEQEVSKRFNRQAGQELSVISGVIELDPDPMRAEFDAQEIESLVLTDYP